MVFPKKSSKFRTLITQKPKETDAWDGNRQTGRACTPQNRPSPGRLSRGSCAGPWPPGPPPPAPGGEFHGPFGNFRNLHDIRNLTGMKVEGGRSLIQESKIPVQSPPATRASSMLARRLIAKGGLLHIQRCPHIVSFEALEFGDQSLP